MLHQAVDAYEALGDEAAVGRVGLQAAYSLLWAGRWGESCQMAERALAVLGTRATADRATLLAHTGAVLTGWPAPFEVAEERLTQALAIAEELGDPIVRGHCLHFLCINRFCLMHQPSAPKPGWKQPSCCGPPVTSGGGPALSVGPPSHWSMSAASTRP